MMRVYLRRERTSTRPGTAHRYLAGVVIDEKLSGSPAELTEPRAIPVVAVPEPRDEDVRPNGKVVYVEKLGDFPFGPSEISWRQAGDPLPTMQAAAAHAQEHADQLIQDSLDLADAKAAARQTIQDLRAEAEQLECS